MVASGLVAPCAGTILVRIGYKAPKRTAMRHIALIRTCSMIGLMTLGTVTTAQKEHEPLTLGIAGQITDGQKKLQGCSVIIYEGNEIVGQQLTDKSGKFGFALGLDKEFAVVFSKDGFQAKSILVNTHAKLPADIIAIAPIDMDLSLLPASKYEGVDTDVLDFPYSIVKFDKRVMAFTQDQQYTSGMMRTNGALLLQSGRATK